MRVALARSIHERGDAEAAWEVDARASLQQLPHHLQLVVARGDVQHGLGHGLTVKAVVLQSAPTSPPFRSHLTTFCSSPRCADRWISRGRGTGELTAARARPGSLAPRTRVAPPASVQPLMRAALALGAAAESCAAKTSRLQPATETGR